MIPASMNIEVRENDIKLAGAAQPGQVLRALFSRRTTPEVGTVDDPTLTSATSFTLRRGENGCSTMPGKTSWGANSYREFFGIRPRRRPEGTHAGVTAAAGTPNGRFRDKRNMLTNMRFALNGVSVSV